MKIFISMPMHGVPEEELRKRFGEVEDRLEAEGHDWLHASIVGYDACGRDVKNMRIYNLARSMAIMSECDAVYFCKGWEKANGCMIEYAAANVYGLKVFYESAEVHDQPQLLDTQCAVASLYSSITGYNAPHTSIIGYDSFGREVNERLMKGSWEGQQ